MKLRADVRRTAVLVSTLVAASSLAACSSSTTQASSSTTQASSRAGVTPTSGSGTASGSDTSSPGSSGSAGDTGKPVTINWWHIQTNDPTKSTWVKVADDYMKLHPNVKIVQTSMTNEDFKAKLATSMQAGNGPDLFHSWGGGSLAQYGDAGLLKDLTSDMKGAWGDSFNPAAVGMMSADGHTWAAPFQLSGIGLWYNQTLFSKAGIASPPATWDEFLGDVKKLKDAGIVPVALGNKEGWEGMYWYMYLALRAGGQEAFVKAADQTGSFDSPAFIQAGTRLKELIAAGAFPSGFQGVDYNAEEVMMGSGKAAMELMGDWSPSIQKASDPDKKGLGDALGFMPFPTLPGGAGNAKDMVAGVGGYAVNRNAPPEAVDFIKFFTTKTNEDLYASQGLFLPSAKDSSAALTAPELKQVSENLGSAPYLQNFYDQALPQSVAVPLVSAITGVFAGSNSPEQAAQKIQAAAHQFLK